MTVIAVPFDSVMSSAIEVLTHNVVSQAVY